MLGLLNISEAMSIALHICVWLAAGPARFHAVRQISAKLGFSPHHVEKVVQQLVRSGIVETERGPAGGVRLARPSAAITLLEIYAAAGGNATYEGCLLKHDICKGGNCVLGKLLARENKRLAGQLQHVTLAGVARGFQKKRAANPSEDHRA